jgi:hypothetical protein
MYIDSLETETVFVRRRAKNATEKGVAMLTEIKSRNTKTLALLSRWMGERVHNTVLMLDDRMHELDTSML